MRLPEYTVVYLSAHNIVVVIHEMQTGKRENGNKEKLISNQRCKSREIESFPPIGFPGGGGRYTEVYLLDSRVCP